MPRGNVALGEDTRRLTVTLQVSALTLFDFCTHCRSPWRWSRCTDIIPVRSRLVGRSPFKCPETFFASSAGDPRDAI